MKSKFKGYELSIERRGSVLGVDVFYFSITRLSDGRVVVDDLTLAERSETVWGMLRCLRADVEDMIANPHHWEELDETKTA